MKKLAFVMAASLLVAITGAAAAKAEPGGPDGANNHAHFYDCIGPAGTPSSFDAESQHLGAAWHLTDTLVVVTPGFNVNAVEAVTCRSVRPSSGHVFRVTGVLTPATGG
jgi:hypothetical protein